MSSDEVDGHERGKRNEEYHELCFSSDAPFKVQCNISIRGIVIDTYRLRKTEPKLQLPDKQAYTGNIPINTAKMEDIKKSLVYVTEERVSDSGKPNPWLMDLTKTFQALSQVYRDMHSVNPPQQSRERVTHQHRASRLYKD
uniref:Uncharacterized protein n=1 Tax=Timema bartmani TaxID=61472 RepID=A0A7R9F6R8_9NEOP|nr:unnamed protein product [Timema bartmani]